MSVSYRLPRRHRDTAKTIGQLARKYAPLLGLSSWEITLAWDDIDDGGANCEASPEYYQAKITFDLGKLSGRADQLEDYVRHELLHCVLWPLAEAGQLLAGGDKGKEELIQKIEERVTSDLERLPLWSLIE